MRCRELLDAPEVPPEIDYSHLAIDADLLGLILHEAVGHAAEGDAITLGSSGFGSQNFRNEGAWVAAPGFDVCIDGTLPNCGFVPIDAEGVVPLRKTIVRNGQLVDALHTRQTAHESGGVPDGCARQESLDQPSLNRMTSIWLIAQKTEEMKLPEEQVYHRLDPKTVQEALEKSGDLNNNNTILFLSGWKGGTASCSNLEFRADVAYIYKLVKNKNPTLMREANFTGIATACFQNVVKAFGPHLCRTIGTCGKDGQMVPTSDGGPALVLMKRNEHVSLIGAGGGHDD
jgi:TldD protein